MLVGNKTVRTSDAWLTCFSSLVYILVKCKKLLFQTFLTSYILVVFLLFSLEQILFILKMIVIQKVNYCHWYIQRMVERKFQVGNKIVGGPVLPQPPSSIIREMVESLSGHSVSSQDFLRFYGMVPEIEPLKRNFQIPRTRKCSLPLIITACCFSYQRNLCAKDRSDKKYLRKWWIITQGPRKNNHQFIHNSRNAGSQENMRV